jgi:NAD(P)-dependent dehydrogenase (short-subunit alcohol dehydrogenase family)
MAHFAQLVERWGLFNKGVSVGQLAALLWSSYLVGMELPGRRALFWTLEMSFHPSSPAHQAPEAPIEFSATAMRSDRQLEFVEVAADLSRQGAPVARARIRAFVRRASPESSVRTLQAILPRSDRLRGKVALVVGGSRGLGASIVQALALQGYHVMGTYRRSAEEAGRVRTGVANAPGSVDMVQGDASDGVWCRDVLREKVASHGGLDILVCNAAPPIRPLGLSLDEMGRFQDFVSSSLALVAVPMAAFLDGLSARSGWSVVISSGAVRSRPADWPHYIAAKYAAEGLAHWAATRYKKARFLVVRPPRLLTDQMNTPAGRQDAMQVEQVAAAIIRRLCDPAPGEAVDLLEAF